MDVMSLCEELLVSFPFLVLLYPPPTLEHLSFQCFLHEKSSQTPLIIFLSVFLALLNIFYRSRDYASFHLLSCSKRNSRPPQFHLGENPLSFAAARSFHLIACIEVQQKPLCTNWKVFILLSQFSRHPSRVLSDQKQQQQQPPRSFSNFCNEICFTRQQQERENAELQVRWKALELFLLSHGLLALIVDGIWSWEEDFSWLILQKTSLVMSVLLYGVEQF